MTKQTTKISLPPRAVVGITLRKAAQSPALRTPRGVDVSPLIVVQQPVKPVGQSVSGERLAVAGAEPELLTRIAKLEAEIAELRAERGRNAPATGAAAVIERLARERVERELAAMVTGEAQSQVRSPARKRWWQWW